MAQHESVELHPTPDLDAQKPDSKIEVKEPVKIQQNPKVEVDYRFSTED